jgi:hypothetical protein
MRGVSTSGCEPGADAAGGSVTHADGGGQLRPGHARLAGQGGERLGLDVGL